MGKFEKIGNAAIRNGEIGNGEIDKIGKLEKMRKLEKVDQIANMGKFGNGKWRNREMAKIDKGNREM